LGVTLGSLVAASPVSVVEYELRKLVGANVEENHALTDDWESDADVPSCLSLRGAPETAALSDVEDETEDVEDEPGEDREERATSPVRRREDAPSSLMYQHPWFVAGSVR
jgi:hypothetical protein